MKSIRANLVLWMVTALALGSIVVLGATYALTRNQVGRVFDEELRQVAHAVHLREDWMQTRRVRIARPGFALSVRAYDKTGRVYFETALPSLPSDLQQTFDEGLASMGTQEGPWRVYTHVTEEGIVQVGQPVATRDVQARVLTRHFPRGNHQVADRSAPDEVVTFVQPVDAGPARIEERQNEHGR